jgi:hypothetical protein
MRLIIAVHFSGGDFADRYPGCGHLGGVYSGGVRFGGVRPGGA